MSVSEGPLTRRLRCRAGMLAQTALPPAVVAGLYASRRMLRRWRFRYRQVLSAGHGRVTGEECRDVLAVLGIERGDVVMTHSAMSRLGFIEGGAETLLRVLLEAVGEEGTLLMPAYPIRGRMAAHVSVDPVFDTRRDPSRTGRLSECLRLHPGARRSLHPTHSVAAVGPEAEYLLTGHERGISPFGPESPFQKLIALGGKILCLGIEIAHMSSVHVPEEKMRPFPRKVYLDEPVQLRVLDDRGGEHEVTTLVHDPAVAATRIEKNPKLLAEIKQILRDQAILREQRLGRGTVSVVSAPALETCLEALAADGLTIYSVVRS